jgi:hypothetical protein
MGDKGWGGGGASSSPPRGTSGKRAGEGKALKTLFENDLVFRPLPDPQGEGTPHPALQRVEPLWIGESAASDSPPQGGGLG